LTYCLWIVFILLFSVHFKLRIRLLIEGVSNLCSTNEHHSNIEIEKCISLFNDHNTCLTVEGLLVSSFALLFVRDGRFRPVSLVRFLLLLMFDEFHLAV
jgi:hypothetical protein